MTTKVKIERVGSVQKRIVQKVKKTKEPISTTVPEIDLTCNDNSNTILDDNKPEPKKRGRKKKIMEDEINEVVKEVENIDLTEEKPKYETKKT